MGRKEERQEETNNKGTRGRSPFSCCRFFLPSYLPSFPSISRERGRREREREREREGEEPNGKVVSKKDPEPSSFR